MPSGSDSGSSDASTGIQRRIHNRTVGYYKNKHVVDYVPSYTTMRRRSLSWWQIALMATNGVIGAGYFINSSYALSVAGPVGAVLGIFVVGIIAICAMESFGELFVAFPTTNATVDFVHAFVDQDLAILVGLACWFMQTIVFVSQIVSALNLISFWNSGLALRIGLTILIPLVLYVLNSIQVRAYGHIEAGVGIVKLLIVSAIFVGQCVAAVKTRTSSGDEIEFLSAGIKYNSEVASSTTESVWISISLAIFSFLGFDTVATASFEAYNPRRDLSPSVRFLPWIVTVIYIVLSILSGATISWTNDKLPQYSNQVLGGIMPLMENGEASVGLPATVLAIMVNPGAPSAIVALLLYITLSSASVALYSASRTLQGMASHIDANHQLLRYRMFGWFGLVEHKSKVPRRAIAFSAIAFIWVPFLCTSPDKDLFPVIQILVSMAVISGVLVWAAQCLAYIRFHWFRSKFAEELTGPFQRFKTPSGSRHLTNLQPVVAWLGLFGSVLLLTTFVSAILWNGQHTRVKALGLYLSPSFGLYFWFVIKMLRFYRTPYQHRHLVWSKIDSADQFKDKLTVLNGKVYPTDYPARSPNNTIHSYQKIPQPEMLQRGGIGFPTQLDSETLDYGITPVENGMQHVEIRNPQRVEKRLSGSQQARFAEDGVISPIDSPSDSGAEDTAGSLLRSKRTRRRGEITSIKQLPTLDENQALYPDGSDSDSQGRKHSS